MLPKGTDLLYRQALATSHQPYLKIEVWRSDGSERLEDDLIIESGSVRATLTSRVTRTFDFTVTEDLYPFEPDDLLNPYSNEVRAFRGIEFADGTRYSWQVFRGRIVTARLNGELCDVSCADRAADIVSANFEVPENSQFGNLVDDEVQRLILDGLLDATFGTSDSYFQTMPIETWEHDRAGALDEIATSVGSFWYCLANGDFVLRKRPWTVPGVPVVTFSDYLTESDTPPTVLLSNAERSRETVFNSITVTGERTDSTDPVFFTARDENPTNPTYINGPFGIRNKLMNLRTPSTPADAREAAEDALRSSTALTEAWSFSVPADASLELGDVVKLDVRGRRGIIQVVAGFDLPMTVEGIMNVACRAQVIGLLEEG